MADKSEGSLDGKPLSSLRVVDLKNALQERGLPKGGSKKELVERLKLQLELEKLQQESADSKDQVPNLALQDELGGQNDFVRQYLAAQQQTFAMQLKERRLTELQASGSTPEAPSATREAPTAPRQKGPQLPVAVGERAKRESWERKRGRQCPSSIDPGGLLESPTRGEPPLEADAPTEARRTRLSTRQGDLKSEVKIEHNTELKSELHIRVKIEPKRKPKARGQARSEPRQLRHTLSPTDHPPKRKQLAEPSPTRLPSESEEDACKRLQGPKEEHSAVGMLQRVVRSPRKAAMAPVVLLRPLEQLQTPRYPSRRRQSSSDESAKNLPQEGSLTSTGDDTNKLTASDLQESGTVQPSLDAQEGPVPEARPRSKQRDSEARKSNAPLEKSLNDSTTHTVRAHRKPPRAPPKTGTIVLDLPESRDVTPAPQEARDTGSVIQISKHVLRHTRAESGQVLEHSEMPATNVTLECNVVNTTDSSVPKEVVSATTSSDLGAPPSTQVPFIQQSTPTCSFPASADMQFVSEEPGQESSQDKIPVATHVQDSQEAVNAALVSWESSQVFSESPNVAPCSKDNKNIFNMATERESCIVFNKDKPPIEFSRTLKEQKHSQNQGSIPDTILMPFSTPGPRPDELEDVSKVSTSDTEEHSVLLDYSSIRSATGIRSKPPVRGPLTVAEMTSAVKSILETAVNIPAAAVHCHVALDTAPNLVDELEVDNATDSLLKEMSIEPEDAIEDCVAGLERVPEAADSQLLGCDNLQEHLVGEDETHKELEQVMVETSRAVLTDVIPLSEDRGMAPADEGQQCLVTSTEEPHYTAALEKQKEDSSAAAVVLSECQVGAASERPGFKPVAAEVNSSLQVSNGEKPSTPATQVLLDEPAQPPLQTEEATHTTAPPIQSETVAALRPVTSTFSEASDSSTMRSFSCQEDNNATNQEVKIQAFIFQVSDLHSHEVSLSLTTANEKSEKSSDKALADADSCLPSTAECSTQLSETASTGNLAGMLQYPNEKLEVALLDKNYDEHTHDASPKTCLHQLEQRPYVAELAYSTVGADEVQVEAPTSLPEVTVDSGTVRRSSDPPSGASAPCSNLSEDPVGGKALGTTLSIEGSLEEHLETHVASISQSQASRQDANITKQQDTEPAQKQAAASEKGCFVQHTYYIDACKPQLEAELPTVTVSEVTTSLQTTTAGTSLTKQQDTEVARVKESVEDMQYEIQHHASIDLTNDICKPPQVDSRRDQTFETTKALSPQETDVAREELTTTEGMPSCLENNAPVDASINVCMSPQITLEAEYMHSASIRASTPELQANTVEPGILARQERDNRPQGYPPVDATVDDLKISEVLPEEDSTTQISVAPFKMLERTTLEACVNTQQHTRTKREETTSIAEVQFQALTIVDPRNDTCVTSQAELEETSTHPTAIEIAGSEPDVLMTETDITRQQGADVVIKEAVEEAQYQSQDYASIDVSPRENMEKECTVVNKASMHQANKEDLHIIRELEITKEAAATEEAQSQDDALVHDRTDVFKTCHVGSEEPIDTTICESTMPQPASTVETCNIMQESGRTAREKATSTESMQYQYQGHVSVDAASDAYHLDSVKLEDSSTPSVAMRGTGYTSKCYMGIATEAASTTDLPSDQLKNHISVDDARDVCKASQAESEKESEITETLTTVLQTDQDTEMVKENGAVTEGMRCHSCASESDYEHRSSAISAIPITNIEIAAANQRDVGVAKREPTATVEIQRTSTDVTVDACKLSEVEPKYPPMDTATATSEAPIMIVQENIVETGAACQQDAEISEKGLAATEEMQLHTEHHSSTDATLVACEASKVKSEDQLEDTVVGDSLISTHQSITIQSDVSSSQCDTEAVKKEASVTDGMQCQMQNHSRDVCQLSCVQSGFQPTDTTKSKASIATFQATIMESDVTSQQGPKFATVIEGGHYQFSNQAPVDTSRSQVQPEEEPTVTDQASAALAATLQATTADTSATCQQDTEVDKEESTAVREAHNHLSSSTATADECSAFQAESNRETADIAITGTVEACAEAVSQLQHCIASMPKTFAVTSAACARDITETTSQLNTEISNAPELLYSMGSMALLHKEQAQTEHPYDCTVSTRCPNSADVASNIVTTSSAFELAMRNVPLESHPKEPQALSHININLPGAAAIKATGVTTDKPSQISSLGSADSSQLDVLSSVSDPTPSNTERCDSTYEACKTPNYSRRILHERISSTPDSTGTERPVLVSVTCKDQTPSVTEISEQKKVVESTSILETLNLPSSSESREDRNAGLKCPETSQLAGSMHCPPITELHTKTTEENRDVQAEQGHDVECQPCPGTCEGDERLPGNLKPSMLREDLDETLPSCNVSLSERCQEIKGACMTEGKASFDNTSRCSNCPQSQELEKVPSTRALSSLEVGIENPIGNRPQASSSLTNPNSFTETLMQCGTPCHVNLDGKEETSSVPQCHRAAPKVQGDINRLGTGHDVLGLAKRSSSSSSTSGSSTSGSGSSGSTNGSSESDSSGSSGDDSSSSSSSDSSASDEERGAAMARLRGRGVRKQAVRTAKEATSDQEASDREGSDGEESDSGGQARRLLRNGRRARSPPEEGRVTRRTLRQRKPGGDAPDEAPKREDSSDTERDGSPAEERRSPEKAAEEDPNGKVAPADEEQQPSGPAWKETLAIKVLNLSSDSSESSEAEEERVGRRALKGTGPTSPPRSPSAAAPEAASQEERESPCPPAEESSKKDGAVVGGVEVAEEDEAGRPESEEPAKEENATPPDIEMKEAPRSISPPKFKARRISTAALKRESRDKEDKPQRKRRWGSTNVVVGPSVSISTSALKDLIPDLEPVASKMKEESLASVPEEPVASADKPVTDKGEDAELAKTSDEPPAKVQAVAAPVVQPKEAKPVVEDGQPVSERKPIHALADRAPLSRRAKEESVRKEPSPAKNPKTRTLFVRNLVRPFTLNQLKQLLLEFGETVDSEFWIDKIKSKCFVTYTTEEEAAKAREALHNLRWPLCNPKILHVDFSTPEEMARQKEPPAPRPPAPLPAPAMPVAPDRSAAPAFHRTVEVEPRPPGRDVREARDPREVRGTRDTRDVRDARDARDVRESRNVRESREPRDAREGRGDPRALPVRLPVREEHRTAPERQAAPAPRRVPMREWDRDKLRQETPPQEQRPRPPKDVKDRAHTPDKKERRDKKVAKRKQEDTPAKLLDDLFRKTKATPCIYWLPLTDDQIAHKEEERKQRRLDRERRRQQQQLQEEEDRRKRALARDLDSKARDSKRTGSHSPVRRR
ncbi:serine-rich adhesin for platelets isoform X2 [Ixodes scapularis]|uniref:serine-rich adhesin for platelets isoform X2 n=1 Tax=Ixodes scapularis TaxID=6945 RepID=UPI001A9E56E9|nr:serine-rich adhesin for platelets isoform X2 [Ixodes scapularis]